MAEQENIKFSEYEQSEEIAETEFQKMSEDTTEKLNTIVLEIDAAMKGN
jgi:hypothetical protein